MGLSWSNICGVSLPTRASNTYTCTTLVPVVTTAELRGLSQIATCPLLSAAQFGLSLPKLAKDKILSFAFLMAAKTLRLTFFSQQAFRLTVAGEPLKAPPSGCGKLLRVLDHDIDSLARSLEYQTFGLFSVQQIEHQRCSVLEFAGFVTPQRFFVGVDVMNAAAAFKERTLWPDDGGAYMNPMTVASGIGHRFVGLSAVRHGGDKR